MEKIKAILSNKLLVVISLLVIVICLTLLVVWTTSLNKTTQENLPALPTPTSVKVSPPLPQPTTLEELKSAQSNADKNYADINKAIQESYPWIDDLPLQTPSYFVYFDTQKKQFIANLYPTSSPSTIPYTTQVETIKATVIRELQRLGINTSQYPIIWKEN